MGRRCGEVDQSQPGQQILSELHVSSSGKRSNTCACAKLDTSSHEPQSNCAFQPQYAWFKEYFANCGTCFHDTWALNLHDYSCNLASTKSLVADMNAVYPNKNIFFGEIGCNGPTADQMAQYLEDFVAWAYGVPTIVGFIWSAINSVGTKGSELSLNGQLQPVGRAFKDIQNRYPPKLTP